MSILAFFAVSETTTAGPFANFFKKIRYSINHPDQKPHVTKSSKRSVKSSPNTSSTKRNDTNEPPNGENVRAAKAVPGKKDSEADLRYGTPVPGRDGFVTSPFAPNSGYVDVRGIPPGTRVKDPFTGKTFLTP